MMTYLKIAAHQGIKGDPKVWPEILERADQEGVKEGPNAVKFGVHTDSPGLQVGSVMLPLSVLEKMRGVISDVKFLKFHGVEIAEEIAPDEVPEAGDPAFQFLQERGISELGIIALPVEAGFLICEDMEGTILTSEVIEGDIVSMAYAGAMEAAVEREGYRVLGVFHSHPVGPQTLSAADIRSDRHWHFYLSAIGGMRAGCPYVNFFVATTSLSWTHFVLSGAWVVEGALIPQPDRLLLYTSESIILNYDSRLEQAVPSLPSDIFKAAKFTISLYYIYEEARWVDYNIKIAALYAPFFDMIEIDLSTFKPMELSEEGRISNDIAYAILFLIFFNSGKEDAERYQLVQKILSTLDRYPDRNRLLFQYFWESHVKDVLNYELEYPRKADFPEPPRLIQLLQSFGIDSAHLKPAEELNLPWVVQEGVFKLSLKKFGRQDDSQCVRCVEDIRNALSKLIKADDTEYSQFQNSIQEHFNKKNCKKISLIEDTLVECSRVREYNTTKMMEESRLNRVERMLEASGTIRPAKEGITSQPIGNSLRLGHLEIPRWILERVGGVIEEAAKEKAILPYWEVPEEVLYSNFEQFKEGLDESQAETGEFPVDASFLFYRERQAEYGLGEFQLTAVVKGMDFLHPLFDLYEDISHRGRGGERWLGTFHTHVDVFSWRRPLVPASGDIIWNEGMNAEIMIIGALRDGGPCCQIFIKKLFCSWEEIKEVYQDWSSVFEPSVLGGWFVSGGETPDKQSHKALYKYWEADEVLKSESILRRMLAKYFHIAVVDLTKGQVIEKW